MKARVEMSGLLPLAVSVAVAASLVSISRAKFYPLVMAKDVRSFKVGGRRLILVADLKEWAEGLAHDSNVGE